MNKTMLLAGKDYIDASKFSEEVLKTKRNIIFTLSDQAQNKDIPSNLKTVQWHSSSAISAKSVILQAETSFSEIDEAILFFDEVQLSKKYQTLTIDSCTSIINNLILSYQFLTMELLNRFEKKNFGTPEKKPGKLIFMIKTCPSVYETVHSSSLKTKATSFADPFIATAAQAFISFAENIATLSVEKPCFYPLLVKWNETNDVGMVDKTLVSWLCNYLTALDNLKSLPAIKQATTWIKPGAKGPGGLFSRSR